MMFELVPFARPADYGEGIVPLADLKDHLEIAQDETRWDGPLTFYRDAGVEMVEDWCELKLAPCLALEWRAEQFTEGVRIPDGPNLELVSVDWLDSDGAPQSAAASTFRVGLKNALVAAAGEAWPSGVDGAVVVTYNAGFAEGEAPAKLVQAVKMFAAHLFKNREAVTTGTVNGEVPLGFKELCSKWTPVRI